MGTSNSIDEFNKSSPKANNEQENLLKKLKNELGTDEELKWSGLPTPIYFGPAIGITMLFAIPWTAFAIFWTVAASSSGTSLFGLFGVPFILVGLSMLLSPVFQYKKLQQTIYGITNKRALIITRKTVTSISPAMMTEIIRNDRKNGFSDIIFRRYRDRNSDGGYRDRILGFVNISDGRQAEQALAQLKG